MKQVKRRIQKQAILQNKAWIYRHDLKRETMMDRHLVMILLLSEVYRMTEPEEKRHGHNVQYPPV